MVVDDPDGDVSATIRALTLIDGPRPSRVRSPSAQPMRLSSAARSTANVAVFLSASMPNSSSRGKPLRSSFTAEELRNSSEEPLLVEGGRCSARSTTGPPG